MAVRSDEKTMVQILINGDDPVAGQFPRAFDNTDNTKITMARMITPLGPMVAGSVAEGLCLLEFTDEIVTDTPSALLKRVLHSELPPGRNELLLRLGKELDLYFQGRLREFKIPLVMTGTEFQKKVWRALQMIPYGQTRSYQEQANLIGQAKAVRAVGRANGANPIAIIVPCHRVIGKNAQLTGYGGGLWRKRFLLDLEQKK